MITRHLVASLLIPVQSWLATHRVLAMASLECFTHTAASMSTNMYHVSNLHLLYFFTITDLNVILRTEGHEGAKCK